MNLCNIYKVAIKSDKTKDIIVEVSYAVAELYTNYTKKFNCLLQNRLIVC